MRQDPLEKVRWASRVNPRLIRRLYETDARGIVDEELIDEVGFALYSRCQSILQVSQAHYQGRVLCPECRETVIRQGGARTELPITCGRCGWSVLWPDYLKTYQDKHLVGGGALRTHENFVRDFRRARTGRQKVLAIDALLHAFHHELSERKWNPQDRAPGRSAGRELIYAKTEVELLEFLDSLAYGPASTAGLREAKTAWDQKLETSNYHRQHGLTRSSLRHEGD